MGLTGGSGGPGSQLPTAQLGAWAAQRGRTRDQEPAKGRQQDGTGLLREDEQHRDTGPVGDSTGGPDQVTVSLADRRAGPQGLDVEIFEFDASGEFAEPDPNENRRLRWSICPGISRNPMC